MLGGGKPQKILPEKVFHITTHKQENHQPRQIGANIYFILFFVLYLFVPLSSAPAAKPSLEKSNFFPDEKSFGMAARAPDKRGFAKPKNT